ncbi:hypothetical protein AB1L42_15885 [Thalassoglobus sp. JC818]|uniref:hypothetical protein n=1 Tax=Thalassoglobus sp. JC818 TaxID=3232136 RepID=UPI0034578D12
MLFTSSLSSIRDRFFTTNYGSTIILKACGFVEEHHARILSAEDGQIRVRIGFTMLEQFIFNCPRTRPVDVMLRVRHLDDHEEAGEMKDVLPAAKCSQVDVEILPKSVGWSQPEFEQFSRKLLWSLRSHFVSPA